MTAPTECKKRKSFGGESKCRVWFIKRRRNERKSASSTHSAIDDKEATSQRPKQQLSPDNVVVSPELCSQETHLLKWDDKLERLITNHTSQQSILKDGPSEEKRGSDDDTVDELGSEDDIVLKDAETHSNTVNMKPRISRGYGKAKNGIRKPFATLKTINNGCFEGKTESNARLGSTPSPRSSKYGSSICALGSVAVKRRKTKDADIRRGSRKTKTSKQKQQNQSEQPTNDNLLIAKTPLSVAREYFRQLDANHTLHLEDEMDREVFGSPLAGASQHCQTLRTQRNLDTSSPRLLAEYREYCQAAEASDVTPLKLEEFAVHRGQFFKNGLFDGFLDG